MEWNFEGYIDEYGFPVFDDPVKPVKGIDGEMIKIGVITYWKNEVEALKNDSDGLNEFYRQFPRTISHAFRDESKQSLFNHLINSTSMFLTRHAVLQSFITVDLAPALWQLAPMMSEYSLPISSALLSRSLSL